MWKGDAKVAAGFRLHDYCGQITLAGMHDIICLRQNEDPCFVTHHEIWNSASTHHTLMCCCCLRQLVLGPAFDGGYYLLGLTALEPSLFQVRTTVSDHNTGCRNKGWCKSLSVDRWASQQPCFWPKGISALTLSLPLLVVRVPLHSHGAAQAHRRPVHD